MSDRIQKIKEMLAANGADSFLQHALALEYVKLGRDGEARSLFQALLAKDEGYVGSYYHLGKLLERAGEKTGAVAVYERGMKAAGALKDNHAYAELMAAREDLAE